jgi:hypothetical protein
MSQAEIGLPNKASRTSSPTETTNLRTGGPMDAKAEERRTRGKNACCRVANHDRRQTWMTVRHRRRGNSLFARCPEPLDRPDGPVSAA